MLVRRLVIFCIIMAVFAIMFSLVVDRTNQTARMPGAFPYSAGPLNFTGAPRN